MIKGFDPKKVDWAAIERQLLELTLKDLEFPSVSEMSLSKTWKFSPNKESGYQVTSNEIATSKGQLLTGGLATCCFFGVCSDKLTLGAHVTAESDPIKLADFIRTTFTEEELAELCKFPIWNYSLENPWSGTAS